MAKKLKQLYKFCFSKILLLECLYVIFFMWVHAMLKNRYKYFISFSLLFTNTNIWLMSELVFSTLLTLFKRPSACSDMLDNLMSFWSVKIHSFYITDKISILWTLSHFIITFVCWHAASSCFKMLSCSLREVALGRHFDAILHSCQC